MGNPSLRLSEVLYAAVLYVYDTLYAILNKSENATLQYLMFCEKVLVCLSVLLLYVPSKQALFTEFCNCVCAKKIVMLIRIFHTCVALIHKKTGLSLETS